MRSARSFACLAVVAAAAAVPSGAAASSASSARSHPATITATVRYDTASVPAGQPGRPASPAEVELITAAVHDSPLVAGVPASAYAVTDIRLSASTPGWAYAKLVPQRNADLDASRVVLNKKDAGWVMGQIGTVFVGCGQAPASVLAEFTVACG